MMFHKKFLAAIICLLGFSATVYAESSESEENRSYVPQFSATIRAFARQSTATGDTRFQIANARLIASGYAMPWLDYFIQADACDNGKFKILDVYADVHPVKGLGIMIGQMRVPFSVEATRAPWTYYFADVALTNLYANLRSVGIKAGYTVPGTKLYMEGGVFNGSDMGDHTVWNSHLTYGAKVNYSICGFKPEIGFMSRMLESTGTGVRANMIDASLSWKYGNFFTEAEYVYRHYAGSSYKNSHAYDFFVDYGIPLKARMADRISFQGRFDGATAGWSGTSEITARRRVTAGVTASRTIGRCYAAFRINYEQYFYGHTSATISATDNNQLIAGLIVKF